MKWQKLATSLENSGNQNGECIKNILALTKLVANIPMDETPNHLAVAPDGAVYLVSMYGSVGDKAQTGSVTKITLKE
ncbi:hypothetical protein [Serratia marcescens]|uniref:hypothetical protein n=1 Tax=Serratia TaxID=613 RepID=UPI0011B3E64D|nr:hypothetical protein [Serratia marcescens]MCK1091290.1 hypothetical protein [Serratia marcescens]